MFGLILQFPLLLTMAFQAMVGADPGYTDDPICQVIHPSWRVLTGRTAWQTRMLERRRQDVRYQVISVIQCIAQYVWKRGEYKSALAKLHTLTRDIVVMHAELKRIRACIAYADTTCITASHIMLTRAPIVAARALRGAHIALVDAAIAELALPELQLQISARHKVFASHNHTVGQLRASMMRYMDSVIIADNNQHIMGVLRRLAVTMRVTAPVIADMISSMLGVLRGDIWRESIELPVMSVDAVYAAITEAI